MARIVIELTNRCNLSCQHCFTGRHGGNDDLPVSVLQRVLAEADHCGFDEICFTGGDPTLHRHFREVVRRTTDSGYRFGFVTNGWNFSTVYPILRPVRDSLETITFSLDGATPETHDQLRGTGSYRRVLQAMSICVVEEIPFTVNMVITAHNRHELERMVQTATGLRSRGLRFGHLMPAPLTTHQGFDLSPRERMQVEAEVWQLRKRYDLPVAMAPGHHTTNLFPCSPLQDHEVNIDCHGNLTKCCHLSGHGPQNGHDDVIADLAEISFSEAHRRLLEENRRFQAHKIQHFSDGDFQDTDFFPCWYCSLYYEKVDWLDSLEEHPWKKHIHRPAQRETRSSINGEDY